MKRRHSRAHWKRPRRSGFSLIEVLIVAAILSILAGIGLISFQWIMENARKKATIAEARQIATAVAFAHQETSIFPKLNYLIEGAKPYLPGSGDGISRWDAGANNYMIYDGVDYIGLIDSNDPNSHYDVYNRRLLKSWDGSYWGLSPTSKSSVEGPSGYVEMEMPNRTGFRRWPSDQYKRPYVMYLIEQHDHDNDPATINTRFLEDARAEPTFAAAVVSYGADGYPGALVQQGNVAERDRKTRQRHWEELFPFHRYRLRAVDDYRGAQTGNTDAREMMEAYSEVRFSQVGGYTGASVGHDLVGCTDFIPLQRVQGYLTSDDIVIEF